MTGCEKYQELISELLDGELSDAEAAEAQAHIDGCGECRAMYEAFRAVSSAMGAEEVPDTLHSGIMEKVNTAAKAKKTQQKIVRLRPILAAAACLVVVVGTVFALKGNLPGLTPKYETEDSVPAGAPMEMPFSAGPAAADAPAAQYDSNDRTEAYSVTANAGEPAPAEPSETMAEGDGFNYAAEEGEAKVAGANTPENAREGESEYRMTARIEELMPYDAFIGFLVVNTETDEVFEMHLSGDTDITDEVRKALVPGCVVTVEYHTKETDERPVIYADAVSRTTTF